jgi:thymidine phosphorylase
MATTLAESLVQVANGAGLPTRAWLTDMNQVLGSTCGNALEVGEAVQFLRGEAVNARLLDVTRRLSTELLLMSGLAADDAQALQQVDHALSSGRALEQFARMVTALGGPADFCERPSHYLPAAPVQLPVLAPRNGFVAGMATRDIGLAVVELGGGRRMASDTIDPGVGFSHFAQLRQAVQAGEVLAVVHAADASAAERARQTLLAKLYISDQAVDLAPVMIKLITD